MGETKKTHQRGREVIEIPNDDVLEEIMVRLQVKTLIQSQIVSKHWRRMLTSKSFQERYMLHQKTKEPKFLCLYMLHDRSWCKPNIALKAMRLKWSSTCLVQEEEEDYHTSNEQKIGTVLVTKSVDGLLCSYSRDLTIPIGVINPSMRWSQTLPLSRIQLERSLNKKKVEFSCLGFGKDCVTGIYKLVLLHNINDNNTSLACEIFDFGSKQWRQVIPPPHGHQMKYYQAPTFANGWLYWSSRDKTKLVAFDLHMEMFRVIQNPIVFDEPSSSSVYMHMDNIDSLMWISEKNGDGMQHVWRVTNHNTGGALLIMDKMFTFDLKKISSTWFESHCSSLLRLLAISKNGDKVILTKPHSQNLLLFQPLNPTSIHNRILSYSPARPSNSAIVLHIPSLASLSRELISSF